MSRVSLFAVAALSAGVAYGQAVVSTRSGVVHFFEGAVSVGGQPIEARFGKFNVIPEGSELRTAQGRAEVLLTPGVFLRLGDKSAIRLLSNSLADTRVELLEGSALVESAEPADGTSVTLVYQKWKVEQAHQGAYRIDSAPPRVQVRDGEVRVSVAGGDAPVLVAQGMDLPFEAVLSPERSAAEPHDALNEWAEGRDESISADNAIAADIQDPATMTNSYGLADNFTYFPMLGYPSLGSGYAGLYGPGSALYTPGFSSMYLPGLTYRPLYLRLPSSAIGRSLYLPTYSPTRLGGPGLTTPRMPVVTHPVSTTPIGVRPAPTAHPVTPPTTHPVGIHK